MPLFELFLLPLAVSALAAFAISPLVIRWYRGHKWLDDPNQQKHAKIIHTYPVPRGGGIVIFLALLIGTALFMGFDKHSTGILLGALLLMVVGFVDDIRDLNPYSRLGWGLLAAGIVVAAGIGIAYVNSPFGNGVIPLNKPQLPIYLLGKWRTIWVYADIFALLWIVWCMNMINWSKGLDGQLPGIVVIAATVIAILSFRFKDDVTQWEVSLLAGITAGAYLGFLPWNIFPQRMMPGYGGGSLAGYLLAVLSILSGAKLATLIIVLGIPMIDAVYVIIRRIANKRSPVWGDRSHFHHQLLSRGWSKRNIALFYWFITSILGAVALQLHASQKAFTILLIALLFGAVLLWLNSFISSSKPPDRDSG